MYQDVLRGHRRIASLALSVLLLVLSTPFVRAESNVSTATLDQDVRTFLNNELAAHLGDIASFEPPPDRVLGAQTTGEYTWGTFMRSVAAYAQLSGVTRLAGRDLVRTIADIGLLEVRLGGTRFSQLYGALSLRHYGADLSKNPLWAALNPDERKKWVYLLDATRFYNPATKQVINLPENYLGVAARIAAMAWEMKLLEGRDLLDPLLDRAAIQFTSGALYADDALPTGRYDRYSNEYARYVWEAAQLAGRHDLLAALRPSLAAQMRLWWDLVNPDGYGYPWGRSLGIVSYLDTLEIAGFLAINPECRPASLDQLTAAYYRAWQYLRHDYKDERHVLSLFEYGRGNFTYISKDREWQQTVGFFGKLAHAHMQLMAGLRDAQITQFPTTPSLSQVARFEFFTQKDRQAGVWLVRQGALRFALPITTATRPGVADYLPAPHGLPGFAVPVEQEVPALVPFLELEDGRRLVAADGADAVEPASDGRQLRARWTRWAQLGSKPTEFVDPGITSEVEWRLEGQSLFRTERLTAARPMTLKRWAMSVPITGSQWRTEVVSGERVDRFEGREGRLTIGNLKSDWPHTVSVRATEDTALSRGARGSVPLILELEARDVQLTPGTSNAWSIELRVDQ